MVDDPIIPAVTTHKIENSHLLGAGAKSMNTRVVIGDKLDNQIFATEIWEPFLHFYYTFFNRWQHLTGCVGRTGDLLAEWKKSE